ncbi:MAG: PAS domain-containing protein [Polyangiaceae bacterium]
MPCQEWLDELPVYYLVLTPSGRVATMTRRLREALGFDAEEIRRVDFAAKFFPPDIRKTTWPHFLERVLSSDVPLAERLPMVTRAGRTLDVEWRFWARRDEDGRVTQLEGMDIDATSNRDSQRFHLSTSSLEPKVVHLHESLLEYVADHVVLTDHENHVLYVNRAFETVSGISREQAVGKRIYEISGMDGSMQSASRKSVNSSPLVTSIAANSSTATLRVSSTTTSCPYFRCAPKPASSSTFWPWVVTRRPEGSAIRSRGYKPGPSCWSVHGSPLHARSVRPNRSISRSYSSISTASRSSTTRMGCQSGIRSFSRFRDA